MTFTTTIILTCDVPECHSPHVKVLSQFSRPQGWTKGTRARVGPWSGEMQILPIDLCPQHRGWKDTRDWKKVLN